MTQSPPPYRTEERRTLISSTSAQHRGSRHRIRDTRGFSKAFLWGRDVLSKDQALNTTSSGSSSLSFAKISSLSLAKTSSDSVRSAEIRQSVHRPRPRAWLEVGRPAS